MIGKQSSLHSNGLWVMAAVVLSLGSGCTSYSKVVKPVPKLSVLSPELQNLTDSAIEVYLNEEVSPVFPATLAVAKVGTSYDWSYRYYDSDPSRSRLLVIQGEEAAGWRQMTDLQSDKHGPIISQVQTVSSLLVEERPTLKSLRHAAALVHAPLLLVYTQVDDRNSGYNDAAMAYWTIVGLFVVPGNTVGYYSVCQGLLVDTRSGAILATFQGEGMREEHVLPGAVNIAKRRVAEQAQAQAVGDMQKACRNSLLELADGKGQWATAPADQ